MNTPTGQTHRQIFTLDGSNDADSRRDVPFGGFVDIAPHFGGEIPNFLGGENRRYQAKRAKYCHRNYSIYYNHVAIVGGPNKSPTSPRLRRAAIFKTVKLPYLCDRLTDFDEIRHGDACWCPAHVVKFKFLIFDNIVRQVAAI